MFRTTTDAVHTARCIAVGMAPQRFDADADADCSVTTRPSVTHDAIQFDLPDLHNVRTYVRTEAGTGPGPRPPHCPAIEDDKRMVSAYEAIVRQRAEYVPRLKACREEVERLRQMRRHIFHQSRALAQQMLAETGIRVVSDDDISELGEDEEVGVGVEASAHVDCYENHASNEQTLPTKKRPRGRAPATEDDIDFDTHALFDTPLGRLRDDLLFNLRRMSRWRHASRFRGPCTLVTLDTLGTLGTLGTPTCLDYVVARLEGDVYANAQQPFDDLDNAWKLAASRCMPDSRAWRDARKLQHETAALRKAMVRLVKRGLR